MEQNKQDSFRLDARQERTYRRLQLIGLGPASFYRDVCRMMAADPPYESTTHLVAHLLREIESALRDALESFMERSERLSKKKSSAEHTHEEEVRAILKGLNIPETDTLAQSWLRLPGKKNEYALHARAHRDNLARPRPIDDEFRQFWWDMEAILDMVLGRFESRYLESHRTLDELLAKPVPIEADAKTLKLHVPNNIVAFGYFFGRLNDPAWVGLLRAEGFFRHPPAPEIDNEKGTISFPWWPESRYLARMAATGELGIQQSILEIALAIDTENVTVHQDFAEAVLQMPQEVAVEWAKKEIAWLSKQSHLHYQLPENLGALAVHLAKGGEVKSAILLLKELLAVTPNPRAVEHQNETELIFVPEPLPRFDVYFYQQTIQRYIPEMITVAGIEMLTLLCDLLEEAVRLSLRSGKEWPEDISFMWRRDIEEDEYNTFKDLLVSAVWQAAKQIAEADPKEVPPVVELLESRPWRIFHRLALNLLRRIPEAAPELIVARLTNETLFDEVALPEYTQLLEEHFSHLAEEQQEIILGWIDVGPNVEDYPEESEEQDDKRQVEMLTGEDFRRRVKWWKLTHLSPIRNALSGEWKELFDELATELGDPESRLYSSEVFEEREGYDSPKSADELRTMSIEELIAFLRDWRPSGERYDPARSGLTGALGEAIRLDPQRFAAEADRFCGLDLAYSNLLISSLSEPLREKKGFEWAPVLRLCEWMVGRIYEMRGASGDVEDGDSTGKWMLKAILRLIISGLEDGDAEIPYELRSQVWRIVQPLTNDSDPTPEREARSDLDPATLSINTTRGEAMHAVTKYALWVRRHLEKATDGDDRLARGFQEMPEVMEVLDQHLDSNRDPARAVRAVYGQWFPQLLLLDPSWAGHNAKRIFLHDETSDEMRDIAWDTYLTYCAPYDAVFELIKDEYTRAVELINAPTNERRTREQSNRRLANHLMNFYWRGKVDTDDTQGLLARFYADAPDVLRAHALGYIGRSLRNTKGPISPVVTERLQRLWSQRLEVARRTQASDAYKAELAAFGFWFTSEKFDDTWALTQLREALRLSGQTIPDYTVVEHLAKIASAHPQLAVECLELMVEGAKNEILVSSWHQHVRTILATTLKSADEEVERCARALVNKLGARGHLHFADLLT